jgi:hypothetical protein
LGMGLQLHGRATLDGEPAGGVEYHVSFDGGALRGTTDESGYFRVSGIPSEASYVFLTFPASASLDGWRRRVLEEARQARFVNVEIQHRNQAGIRIELAEEMRKSDRAIHFASAPMFEHNWSIHSIPHTDPIFYRLRPSTYRVYVTTTDGLASDVEEILVVDNEVSVYRPVLRPAVTIRLRQRDGGPASTHRYSIAFIEASGAPVSPRQEVTSVFADSPLSRWTVRPGVEHKLRVYTSGGSHEFVELPIPAGSPGNEFEVWLDDAWK